MAGPSITVHHLDNSRSQRVLWLLEELGLEYQLVRYQRDPKMLLAPPSLRAVHPLGKSPVVTIGSEVLAESGAILEELIERYGEGRLVPPQGSPERSRCRYWLHYAEGSLMPLLVMKLVISRIPRARMPFFVRPVARGIARGVQSRYVAPQLRRHLDFVESELARSLWFAGDDVTAADIQMSYPLEAAVVRGGIAAASHPRIFAIVERIHQRAAYQRALERGGPVVPAL
jgi:glutathione S-transferase